jgi:macrolide transport system ATP-binding/permease protein
MELIELRDIYKTYHLGEINVPVLQGISLRVFRGEFVALMGASGSGKTTLLNILGCLDRPTSGEYTLEGQDVTARSADEWAQLRNEKIGFVFQTFNLLPRTSALDNVIMPLSYTAAHLSDREVRQRGKNLLHRVGLSGRLDHEPSQLSGGQQQRVAIARALINSPSILLADEPTGNLDSRTSKEVLELFRRLNEEEGVTIILVTHDAHVARYARRIIRISDGVVQAEKHRSQKALQGQTDPAPIEKSKPHPGVAWLRLRWITRTALNGLRRNYLRAGLTTLGISIGVAAVIAMMEIGRGSSNVIQTTIAGMGANNLLVLPGTASSGGVSFGAGSVTTLTPQDAEAILADCPAVKGAVPVVRARTQVIYSNRNWVPLFIFGTTPGFLDIREWDLDEGQMFSDQDVRLANRVCVLGQRVVWKLFQGESPLGKEVRIQNISFRVVGILSSKGANMLGMDQDDILLAPWTTIKFRVTGSSAQTANQSTSASSSPASTFSSSGSITTQMLNTLSQVYPSQQRQLYPVQSPAQQADMPMAVRFVNVDQILTAARDTKDIPLVTHQIIQLLRERHRIRPGEPDDFFIRDITEVTRVLTSIASLMTKLLLIVALISLFVGGVGIMNIMLVSVTERTREIGLRMAVGAWARDIMQQFLAESVILCFCGGVAGILVGRGISMLVRILLSWPTELSLDAVIAAVAVSVTVGIIFGYYPAWKAAHLDPIISLRYE